MKRKPTLADHVFLMKQHFMCVDQSTGKLLYMGKHKFCWCSEHEGWKTRLSVLYFLKNPWQLVILFWLWQITVLCVMSLWEQFSSWMMHHLSSAIVCAFLERVFSGCWVGRQGPIPWVLCSPDMTDWIFSSEVYRRHCLS